MYEAIKAFFSTLTTVSGTKTSLSLKVLGMLGLLYFVGMNAYSVLVRGATFGPTEFATAFAALMSAFSGLF